MAGTGAMLRAAREAAAMPLTCMARRTSYSMSYLSLIETGKRPATAAVLKAYERTLGAAGLTELAVQTILLTGLANNASTTAAAELIEQAYVAALDRHQDDWTERTENYGQAYMTMGANELKTQLGHDLLGLRGTVDSAELWSVSGRLLALYGKITKGPKQAAKWYRLANRSADRSGNNETRIWTRGRAALAFAYEGAELAIAQELAEQALAISDKASMGRLNALLALAHIYGNRGDSSSALTTFDDCRRLFDVVGSYEQISDFAMPEWRFAVHESMLFARLGDHRALDAQETTRALTPAELPRFRTHIELHRGLMLVKSGDATEGIRYARNALAALPEEKHSLSLKLMMSEISKARKKVAT